MRISNVFLASFVGVVTGLYVVDLFQNLFYGNLLVYTLALFSIILVMVLVLVVRGNK